MCKVETFFCALKTIVVLIQNFYFLKYAQTPRDKSSSPSEKGK